LTRLLLLAPRHNATKENPMKSSPWRPAAVLVVAGFGVLAAGSAGLCSAQAWPVKPVRMVIPIAGGGSTDAIARLVGTKLGEVCGQQLVVENRPGGSTMIGAEGPWSAGR